MHCSCSGWEAFSTVLRCTAHVQEGDIYQCAPKRSTLDNNDINALDQNSDTQQFNHEKGLDSSSIHLLIRYSSTVQYSIVIQCSRSGLPAIICYCYRKTEKAWTTWHDFGARRFGVDVLCGQSKLVAKRILPCPITTARPAHLRDAGSLSTLFLPIVPDAG